MSINIAIDGPAGAGKAPLQKPPQRRSGTFTLTLEPCTALLPTTFCQRARTLKTQKRWKHFCRI